MGINGPPSYTYCANGEHNMLWIWPRILPLIIKGKGKVKVNNFFIKGTS